MLSLEAKQSRTNPLNERVTSKYANLLKTAQQQLAKSTTKSLSKTRFIRPFRNAPRYLHSAQPLPNSSSFSSPGSAARAWSRRLFTPMKNWRIMTTSR